MEVPLNIFRLFLLGEMEWLMVMVVDMESVASSSTHVPSGGGVDCISNLRLVLN